MSQPLLSDGEVIDTSDELDSLRDRIDQLEGELRIARTDLIRSRADAAAATSAIAELRRQLSPLHRALRAVFGEIDLVGGVQDHPVNSTGPATYDSRKLSAWEEWKKKLPGFPSRFIDALLQHGELSVAQLVVAAQCPRKQTIYDAASKLQRLGLITNNGGKYALKEL